MTTDHLTTAERIIAALEELQEIHGTEYLTFEVLGNSRKSFVRAKVRQLAQDGECEIIYGNGRGHKTIYRRNRNSPGSPRRDDKHKRQIP